MKITIQKNGAYPLAKILDDCLLFFKVRLKKIAAFLQMNSNGCPVWKKKWILFGFCLLFGGESSLVIYRGLVDKTPLHLGAPIKFLPLKPFWKPTPLPKRSKELDRIHRFVTSLDSLEKTSEGKRLMDSLIFLRPHLIDTLQYLENLYYGTQYKRRPTAFQ